MAPEDELSWLRLGTQLDHPDKEVSVDPRDIAQHTAILAQSGAGKSSFLARLIEETVVATRARVLVVDTNGDFRRAYAIEEGTAAAATRGQPGDPAFVAAWRGGVRKVFLQNGERPGDLPADVQWSRPLVYWWSLDMEQQAELLAMAMDWDMDDYETDLLQDNWETYRAHVRNGTVDVHTPEQAGAWPPHWRQGGEFRPEPASWWSAVERYRRRTERAEGWCVWAPDATAPTVGTFVGTGLDEWDLLVLDLPSVPVPQARLLLMAEVLECLWARAAEDWSRAAAGGAAEDTRVPTIVALDEAHNFVPEAVRDPLADRVAAMITRIAAEGRKYGLFVLLATQRPAKVRAGLLAECENVCLLRLQSPVDHKTVADTWGAPMEMVQRSHYFRTGQGLLLGRWVPAPIAFQAAKRRTKEGGASLRPEWWARLRQTDE